MGQERELTLAELRDLAPLGIAAQSKMQEAAKLRKEAERAIAERNELAKRAATPQGARDLLTRLAREAGADPNAILRSILEEELRFSQLTPEQQKALAMEQELARYRTAEQQRQIDMQRQQAQYEEQRVLNKWDSGVGAAIKRDFASLPNEVKEELHERALDTIDDAVARGERITYAEAARRAAQYLDTISTKRVSSLSTEQKIALLTPEERQAIAASVAKEQAARNPQPVANAQPRNPSTGQYASPQNPPKVEYKSAMGLVEQIRRLREGR